MFSFIFIFTSCRYYADPFKKENLDHGGGLTRMCSAYVEGLCWVMKYYYQVPFSAEQREKQTGKHTADRRRYR